MVNCRKCGLSDQETEFPAKVRCCRSCLSEYQKQYRQNNAARLKEFKKAKYRQNRESAKLAARNNYWENRDSRIIQKQEYRAENPEKAREISRRSEAKKRQKGLTPEQRLARALRRRIWEALVGKKKTGSAVRDLGCSTTELKKHLENQFREDMNWGNYGILWSVDHIIPLSHFDLEDRDQFLKASHYTNLQPLTISENSRKRDRFVGRRESQ